MRDAKLVVSSLKPCSDPEVDVRTGRVAPDSDGTVYELKLTVLCKNPEAALAILRLFDEPK